MEDGARDEPRQRFQEGDMRGERTIESTRTEAPEEREQQDSTGWARILLFVALAVVSYVAIRAGHASLSELGMMSPERFLRALFSIGIPVGPGPGAF